MMITELCRAPWIGRLALFATLAVLHSSPFAAERVPPEELDGASAVAITIDSEHLIELYQSVPGLRIIDSRLRQDHALGHIEKSHNLPLSQTNCNSLSGIVDDNDQALVFYCNGNGVDTSTEAVQIASSCGYKRLFWLSGGFIEWQDKDYPFVID